MKQTIEMVIEGHASLPIIEQGSMDELHTQVLGVENISILCTL